MLFKIFKISLLTFGYAYKSLAQVAPIIGSLHYGMSAFQPTALPSNHLDKINRKEMSNHYGVYFNGTTRSTYLKDAPFETSILTFDKLFDPELSNHSFKIGGGILDNHLEIIHLVSPFVHVSVILKISQNWRLLGGAGYRYAFQSYKAADIYKEHWDPKIVKANEAGNVHFSTLAGSIAVVQRQWLYLGVGFNNILGANNFANSSAGSFTEANTLLQIGAGSGNVVPRSGNIEGHLDRETTRDMFTHFNISLTTRHTIEDRRLKALTFAQLNGRVSVTNELWFGLGGNTAKRFQVQGGLMFIPTSSKQNIEHQYWITLDIPTVAGRWGTEVNVGYFF
jgi:hypothetical protein